MNLKTGDRVFVIANTQKQHHFIKNEKVTVVAIDKMGVQVTNRKQTSWVSFKDISKQETRKYA